MDTGPVDGGAPAAPVRAEALPRPPRPSRRHLAAPSLIAVAYAVAVFWGLGHPGAELPAGAEQCEKWPVLPGAKCYEMIPLDEVHYVPDARDVIRFGTESDVRVPTEHDGAYVVHPPAGKWFIAAGMKVFGDRPFGWRAFGALFAVAGVLIIYAIAFRIWGSPAWAALAALLLALDGLWFVQARVAMLDIYAATFTLAGIWAVLEARARSSRRWYAVAGVTLGLAMATKWGPLPIVVIAVIAALRWGGRRALITLALVPFVYVAAYVPWFVDGHRYLPPACESKDVATGWLCYQQEMFRFHRDLEKYDTETVEEPTPSITSVASDPEEGASGTRLVPGHPYFGHGYSWPWIGRPVAHHYESEDGVAEEVLGLPNPGVWWAGFFIVIPVLVILALARRDWIARLLLLAIGAAYLPYVAADVVARPVFLFYALPLIPFLILGVVHCFVRLGRITTQAGTIATAFAMICLALAIFFYPVLSARPLPMDGADSWRSRIWLAADCSEDDVIKTRCWI